MTAIKQNITCLEIRGMSAPPRHLTTEQRLLWLALSWYYDERYRYWLTSRGHKTWPDEKFLLGRLPERAASEATGLDWDTLLRTATALVAEGLIEQRGGTDGDPHIWRMLRNTLSPRSLSQ